MDKDESKNDNKEGAPVDNSNTAENVTDNINDAGNDTEPAHKGSLLMDATACPQDIAYPTDLNLLNDAREKSEELIDELQANLTTAKPRTIQGDSKKKIFENSSKEEKNEEGNQKCNQPTITVFKKKHKQHP